MPNPGEGADLDPEAQENHNQRQRLARLRLPGEGWRGPPPRSEDRAAVRDHEPDLHGRPDVPAAEAHSENIPGMADC